MYPVKQIFEHLKKALITRAKASCGSDWTDGQIDEFYNPVMGAITMIDRMTAGSDHQKPKCQSRLGDLNFPNFHDEFRVDVDLDKILAKLHEADDEEWKKLELDKCKHTGYVNVLPNTCTTASLQAGKGCAFQIPLEEVVGTEGFSLGIALNVCPKSMLPFVSIRINGPGATNFFAPCTTDKHCKEGQKCIDLAAALGFEAGMWDEAAEGLANLIFSGEMIDLTKERKVKPHYVAVHVL